MGLFSNLVSNVSNLVSNVAGGVAQAAGGLVSGIIGGAVSSVGSAASQIVGSSTQLVTNVANSPAGSVLAAGFSGYSGQLPASGSSSQPLTLQSIKNAEGRIVRLDSLTGLAKFFCYYKMDADGRVYLDNGKPTLNTGKLIAHVTVLGVVVYGGYRLFKKRSR